MTTADATAFDEALRAALGYRVAAPEGETGVVVRVPEAGWPPRPLVLVIRGGDTFRFMPLQRIERVSPEMRQVLLRSQIGPLPDGPGTVAPHDRRQLTYPRRQSSNDPRRQSNVSVPANGEERVLITAEGYEQRNRELERLENEERQRLAQLLREARADGPLDDDRGWSTRSTSRRDSSDMEAQLAVAEVAPRWSDGRPAVGSVVGVRDLAGGEVFKYELVGSLESGPTKGRVSIAAQSDAPWSARLGAHRSR
jgi:transcription elongation GreA/GreB family factor